VRDNRIAAGFTYGQLIANTLLAARAGDGYNVIPSFVPNTAPGFYRPTAPNFPTPTGQGWGAVTPWGFTDPTVFFPLNSGNTYFTNATRYITDYLEVLGKGRDVNDFQVSPIQRTGIETFAATFWANDFPGTSLPPGQYIQVTNEAASKIRGLPRSNLTRLLALAALSVADSNIVAWNVKYTAQEWRPIAAIQEAATDQYTQTVADPSWLPLSITTPSFPDYISGHATFGWAFTRILQLWTGTDDFIVSLSSDNLPIVTATYRKFSDIANDNAYSRLYLGVHFRAALTDSQQVGVGIANFIWANYLRPA